MRADANDVVNYWSTQATSHATISPMAKLTRRPKKQDAEPERRFPALKEAAQPWWKVPPPIQTAADSFDTRHVKRLARAEAINVSVKSTEPPWSRKALALRKEVFEVATNRYVEPYKRPVVIQRKASPRPVKVVKVVEEEKFDLPTSIWGPRALWCDAKDFYDTVEIKQRRFEIDWHCAIEQLGLVKVILRHDDGDDGAADDDGNGIPDEVEEVGAALWECYDVVFMLYQYFSAVGADISGISFNAWCMFVDEAKLASKRSQFCTRGHFDMLFIKIDTASSRYWKSLEDGLKAKAKPGAAAPKKLDKDKSLSRVEFLAAIVHIAIMKYCETGELNDVSEAVHRLLMKDIVPKVDPSISASPDNFRRTQCYTKDVNAVLRKHETSLRHIFAGVAGGGRSGQDATLVSLNEWARFLRAIDFCGGDLTERDGRFAFVWSIMAVKDSRTTRGAFRQANLPFEGFLEALCRVAGLKALPTDDEIAEAGCPHAGAYMSKLQIEDEESYDRMLEERSTPWSKRFEPPQPMARLVEHTITIMIHCMEGDTAGNDNLQLTANEVTSWLKAKNMYGYYDK